MKTITRFAVVVVCLVSLPHLSAQESDTETEVSKLKHQIIEIQNKGKVGIRNLWICKSIKTYGSYDKLVDAKVPEGAKLLLYYEPVNLFTDVEEGKYTIHFTQDLILLSGDGKTELFRKDEMIKFHYVTAVPTLDVFASNSLALGKLPVGEYKIKGVIRDKNRKEVFPFEFELAFEVVAK